MEPKKSIQNKNDSQMYEKDISKILEKWKDQKSPLLMALHEIQNKLGYIPQETTIQLAKNFNIPLARIFEVLTFNNYFKLKTPGKVVISVCAGTACYLKGSGQLIEELKKELRVELNETSADGRFYLEYIRCLGCCSLAPAMVINGKIYSKVSPEEIKAIISQWKTEVSYDKR